MKAFTFVSSAERLNEFRLAYQSVKKFHPEVHVFLLLCSNDPVDLPKDITIVRYDKPIDCIARLHIINFVLELGYQKIIALDNDMELIAPIDMVWDALDHRNAVVTPHLTVPIPSNDLHPTMEDNVRSGNYNAGFFACRNTPATLEWMGWWTAETTRNPVIDDKYHFNEQGWLRFIADFLDKTLILRYSGINAAYWQLHYMDFHKDINGVYQTKDGPLILYHYSGLEDAEKISKHQNRWTATGDYKEFLQSYIDRRNKA